MELFRTKSWESPDHLGNILDLFIFISAGPDLHCGARVLHCSMQVFST